LKDLPRDKIETQIFIQERKKAPKPKEKKKTISNFFHLDKFQPKRNQKDFQRKQRKWMKIWKA
jgi:hypothetical protein